MSAASQAAGYVLGTGNRRKSFSILSKEKMRHLTLMADPDGSTLHFRSQIARWC
jgi:hypothetical protein